MAWVESHSQSFSARHESAQAEEAAAVLDGARGPADELCGLFEHVPGRDRRGHPPALGRARAGAPVAAAGPARGGAGQPPLLRGLVRGARDPRARARRARAPGLGGARLARGAAAHAAPRVRAPGGRAPTTPTCRPRSRSPTSATTCAGHGCARGRPPGSPGRRRCSVPRSCAGCARAAGPSFPPGPRDAMLLGGTVFSLLGGARRGARPPRWPRALERGPARCSPRPSGQPLASSATGARRWTRCRAS